MISVALSDDLRDRLAIDHYLLAEEWPVLLATLDAASQSRHGAPLAELATKLRAEVQS